MIDYTTTDLEVNGAPRVGICLAAHPDQLFVLGRVSFDLDQVADQLVMSYTYDMIEGSDSAELRKSIGDFVVQYCQQPDNEKVFTNGT